MALFHLVFEFLRISVLSLIYGFVLWLIVAKFFKKEWFKKRGVMPIIFILLLFWRFSYWRNNGLGDSGMVPLNSDYRVTMVDFSSAYLEHNGSNVQYLGNQLSFDKLYVKNDTLYGITWEGDYIGYDLKKDSFINDVSGQYWDQLKPVEKFHSDYWGYWILIY